jgi:hypothetical protein
MAARQPWRTATLVAALTLAADCGGQGTDREAQRPSGPDTAPSSTSSDTPPVLAEPPQGPPSPGGPSRVGGVVHNPKR